MADQLLIAAPVRDVTSAMFVASSGAGVLTGRFQRLLSCGHIVNQGQTIGRACSRQLSITSQVDCRQFLSAFAPAARMPIASSLSKQDKNTFSRGSDWLEHDLHSVEAGVEHAVLLSHMTATLDLPIPPSDFGIEMHYRVAQQFLTLDRKARQRKLIKRKTVPINICQGSGGRSDEVRVVLMCQVSPHKGQLIRQCVKFSNVTIQRLPFGRGSLLRLCTIVCVSQPNSYSDTRKRKPVTQVHVSIPQFCRSNSCTASRRPKMQQQSGTLIVVIEAAIRSNGPLQLEQAS